MNRLLLGLLFACGAAATVQAQSRVRIGILVTITNLTPSSTGRTVSVAVGGTTFRAQAAPNAALTITQDIGYFFVDEGGSAAVATIESTNIQMADVQFYLAERRDEFAVLIHGRQDGVVHLYTGSTTSTANLTVFNRSRVKSQLGSGQGSLVGSCSSPYLQPTTGIENTTMAENIMMDLELGQTQNGQRLPPLKVNYFAPTYTLPEHNDIVPLPTGDPFVKKYRLPQVILTITLSPVVSDQYAIEYSFATRDAENSPYVRYNYTATAGSRVAHYDSATQQTTFTGQVGTAVKWTRTFPPSPTSRDESNGPKLFFGFSPENTNGFTVEDWHEPAGTNPPPRAFDFTRIHTANELTEEVEVRRDTATASHNRTEYYRYQQDLPADDPENPPQTVTVAFPKKFIQGYGSTSALTTEQLVSTGNLVQGTKLPSGATMSNVQNAIASVAGEVGTTKRVVRSWKNAASTTIYGPSDDVPSDMLVTDYEFTEDWTGLKTLPSRVLTKAEGKVVGDETISYVRDLEVDVSNASAKEKIIAATRTVFTANEGVPSRQGLDSISKKFQPNTPSFFYADLFYSLENFDGSKQSFAYQRGSYSRSSLDVAGLFTVTADPDVPAVLPDPPKATEDVRIIVLHGLKTTTSDASPLTVADFDDAKFAPLTLVTGRSTATVEIRRYGLPVRTENWICSSASLATFDLVSWENVEYAPHGGVKKRTTSNGTTYSAHWTGFRKDYEIDETGQRTDYAYDAAGRVQSVTRAEIKTATDTIIVPAQRTAFEYDADNRITKVTVGPEAETGEHLVTTYRYNLAGLLEHQVNPDGTTVDYAYTGGGTHVEVTYNKATAAESTRIVDRYVDGRLISLTGSSAVPEYHTYGFETFGPAGATYDLLRTTAYIGSSNGTQNLARFQTLVSDSVGRAVEQRNPGRPGSANPLVRQFSFDANGRMSGIHAVERAGTTDSQISADTVFHYDEIGQMSAAGFDLGGGLAAGSSDRFVKSTGEFTKRGGANWWASSGTSSFEKNDDATELSTTVYARLTGLGTDGLVTQSDSVDAFGVVTTTSTYVDTAAKIVTEVTSLADGSAMYRDFAGGFLVAERTYASGVTPGAANCSAQTTYDYDELGRMISTTDARGIVTTTKYFDNTARPEVVKSGMDAAGQAIAVATYAYDEAGRVKSVTDAKLHVTYYAYNRRDQIIRQWGDGTKPVSYAYNAYGEMVAMRTFRNPTQDFTTGTWPLADDGVDPLEPNPDLWTSGDKTKWTYDPATGFLTKKEDAAGNAIDYGYSYDFTAGQKIVTRTLARTLPSSTTRVKVTYKYRMTTGDLIRVEYNDGITPAVDYTYTRAGRIETATDGVTGLHRYTYDHGQPLAEFLASYFGNRVVTTNYEAATSTTAQTIEGRYRGVQLGLAVPDSDAGDATEFAANFRYDELGRIKKLDATYPSYTTSATYAYTGGTSHWEKLTHGNFQLSRVLDTGRNLLASVSNSWEPGANPSPIATFGYGHEDRGYIESTTQSGTAFTDFGDATFAKYTTDKAGQLQVATSYLGSALSDTSHPLPGRGFHYDYDAIGNRKTVTVDTESANYRDGDNGAGSIGANSLNQVKSRATLKTHVSGTVSNTPSAATVTVNGDTADRQGAYWDAALNLFNQSSAVVNVSAARGTESQVSSVTTLLRPATETFTYDADGNLTSDSIWTYSWDAENRLTQMTTQAWVTPAKTIFFTYDYLGRRVRKVVQAAGSPTSDRKFVYDGWNLIAEIEASTGAIACSYVWGLDASGSLSATGGVGALVLTVKHAGSTLTMRDVAYDGGGNVVALIDPGTGVPTATYEYDPFGQLLRSTGIEAAANPFRFSTKYCDTESGLYYYGYRYYDTTLGRFINRDPIEEDGGNNLYAFVGNNPVNSWDYLGMQTAADGGGGGGAVDPGSDLLDWANRMRAWLDSIGGGGYSGSSLVDFGDGVVQQGPSFGVQLRTPEDELNRRFPHGKGPNSVTFGDALWDRAGDMGIRFGQLAQATDEGIIRFVMHPIDSTAAAVRGISAAQESVIDRINETWSGGIYRAPADSRATYEDLRNRIANINWDNAPDIAWALGVGWVGGEVPQIARLGAGKLGSLAGRVGRVTVYRVEGLPNTRIFVGAGGRVAIIGDDADMLFLNFGDAARAQEFFAKRAAQGTLGLTLKSFEVPRSFVDDLRAAAVPQRMGRQFPNSPQIADPTKAADQFGLQPAQIEALRRAIIQGSGKVR